MYSYPMAIQSFVKKSFVYNGDYVNIQRFGDVICIGILYPSVSILSPK